MAQNDGVTVFISSHILNEIARLADRVVIIHQGRLVQELRTGQIVLFTDHGDRRDTTMNAMGACIRAEFLKLFRSKVLLITALAFAVFTSTLNYGFDFADPLLLYMLGSFCFSILAAWMFGVEFVHKTVMELLAFPASRSTIVFAKIITLTISVLILSFGQYALSCILSIVTGKDGWTWEAVFYYMIRQGIMAVMMLALCMPILFLGLCSRGYFLPIAVSIAVFVYVNIDDGGLPLAVHIPWRVPLLYAADGQLPRPLDAVILIIMGVGGILASLAWWRHADYAA
jgi:hypothetical protein